MPRDTRLRPEKSVLVPEILCETEKVRIMWLSINSIASSNIHNHVFVSHSRKRKRSTYSVLGHWLGTKVLLAP